jgi:hypothetical protein
MKSFASVAVPVAFALKKVEYSTRVVASLAVWTQQSPGVPVSPDSRQVSDWVADG